MRVTDIGRFAVIVLAIFLLLRHTSAQKPAPASHVVPKTWDDAAMLELEIPVAEPTASPVYITAEYYYRMPVRPIYKSYAVYAPGKEPAGYLEWLKTLEPVEIPFEHSRLKTTADWIKAGELVFDAPIAYDAIVTSADVRKADWYEKTATPLDGNGVVPFARYVVRKRGKIELGALSCAYCHTRVMSDGSVIKGAQGNFPFERAWAYTIRQGQVPEGVVRQIEHSLFDAPWIRDGSKQLIDRMSIEDIAGAHYAMPPGVLGRQGTSLTHPSRIPDLIGVSERKYLDASGLQLNRSIVDLMRYAALNQGADTLSSYKGFIPDAEDSGGLPEPQKRDRYSDEQLYALALYLHSLKPPPNPHRVDRLAVTGERVFRREGCATCHTPPLFTNNKLIPADGFTPPSDHLKKFDILPLPTGTDPTLTLTTRRGTGYYKVPTLRGLWYRSPLEHNGSIATLEDWFDPRRLRDDYVPTGFKGYKVETRAVKGHDFGLALPAAEKKALIAFLRTL